MQQYVEHKRLAALRKSGLLAVESSDALRQLVSYAKADFDVAIVCVSLMGETCLLPIEVGGGSKNAIQREQAFCSTTVAVNDTVVILDASIDPRWGHNSLVEGDEHFRFYAGVPLRCDGQPVGTFCIIDRKPRSGFGEVERRRLEAYASTVMVALELLALKRECKSSETRFERMASVTPDAMIITSSAGEILFVNPQAQRTFGYTIDEFLKLEARDLLPERMRYAPGDFVAMFDSSVGQTQETEGLTSSGAIKTFEFSLSRWVEDGDTIYGAILRDISERKATQEALIKLAHSDGLTELPNRTVMHIRLKEALASGHVAVLLIDLDGFKDINDKFGHAAGDCVLKLTASRLLSCIQPTATAARMGGDEFVIIVPGCGDPIVATAMADNIIRKISDPFIIEDGEIRLGASVGIALGPVHSCQADALLKCADIALYKAKADGRYCYRLYTSTFRGANLDRLKFGQDFHRAIENKEFVLHYQPQVNLLDGSLVGAEALLRWQHPELGLLQPGAFLSALLSSRYDSAIGEWVLRTACHQAASWLRLGYPSFRMGVNVSATHITSGDIAPLTMTILRETSLPPRNLEIEITEDVMLRNDDRTLVALTKLRQLGVGISFDDYGTGYASLSLLKRFPLTRLKIDRSFIHEMTDIADVTIVSAILQLAKGFGLDVIAEGIETSDQLQRLRDKGCPEGQGYLFARPISALDFEQQFLSTAVKRLKVS